MCTFLVRAAAWGLAMLPALAVAAPLTLIQAIDLAVQRSDAAASARAGVASATEAARAADQLPDPTLHAGIDNLPVTGADRLSTARDSMTMKRIGLGQEWVPAEKRAARRAAADALVAREAAMVQVAAAEARLQTARAYVDAYYAGASLALAELAEHHLHEEVEAATAGLASPAGSSAELLALTAARGIAEDESADGRQQQGVADVALERWTGVRPEQLVLPAGWPSVDDRDYVQNHPTVVSARRDVELARRDAEVTAGNRRPNWSWDVSYGQRSGYSDMVTLGVSIPLPVSPGARQDRDTASKLALVDRAEAALDEAARGALAEFRTLTGDAQRLEARILRYQSGVVVPAQQRTAAALAGYASNTVTLAGLFDARHMEVEAQRKLLALQRDLARTQAQLAYRPIPTGGVQ